MFKYPLFYKSHLHLSLMLPPTLRISEIIGIANFSEIDNLLAQGGDMNYVAKHYHLDLALA